MKIFIVICGILIIGCLVAEKIFATRHRLALRHVIHVNGTRGKSAVTRLIAAGISESGMKVYCKTTGTLPMIIDCDGNEREIKRLGKANIAEQIKTLKAAAKAGAEVLVVECMAVDPELQKVCEEKILKADIGVITNARVDHVAEMGSTEEEVCECLLNTAPKNGKLFTADSSNFAQMEERAKTLNCEAYLADTNSYNFEDLITEDFNINNVLFPENITLALKVCEAIGIDKSTALRGFSKVQADPYEAAAYKVGDAVFVDAMSANDPVSTKMVYERFKKLQDERLIIILNTRADRAYRTNLMIDAIKDLGPDKVWLVGPGKSVAARKLKKLAMCGNIKTYKKAEAMPLDIAQKGDMILAIGNIANDGLKLMDIIEEKGEKICTDR